MNIDIKPVILCGGSGTRLWPLSRQSLPKQFVPMIDGKSLLELTLRRVKDLPINQFRFLQIDKYTYA
jgi:mannose-1-phosphate guanylyltransferase/mannose-6-phosphate isomerase